MPFLPQTGGVGGWAASHLPSRSPIQPTVKEETMPPMANTDTERDQNMVRTCGEAAGSSGGASIPSVLPQAPVPGMVLGTVLGTVLGMGPSSPEVLGASLSMGTMPSTRA